MVSGGYSKLQCVGFSFQWFFLLRSAGSVVVHGLSCSVACGIFILCRPLLLLPPIPPSIRVFSNESTRCMRWSIKFKQSNLTCEMAVKYSQRLSYVLNAIPYVKFLEHSNYVINSSNHYYWFGNLNMHSSLIRGHQPRLLRVCSIESYGWFWGR